MEKLDDLREQNPQAVEADSNVVAFSAARRRGTNCEPLPTDEEMSEYRRIRPMLLKIIEEWPELRREHRTVMTTCPLAMKLLK